MDKLFSTEEKGDGISDDDRKLMDDLQITPDSVMIPFTSTLNIKNDKNSLYFSRNMQLQTCSPATKRFSHSNVPFHV